MTKPCLVIAGEKSGEEHALSFLPALKAQCPELDFFGVGGDELKSFGMEIIYHLKDFSSFGFSEVISKIPFYFQALNHLEDQVLKRGCKLAILIDFQDFNLRLAKRLERHGVKVLYYVAPQAWAWKAKRAAVLQRTVHTLFTILPFEKDWFNQRGVNKVASVVHPLVQRFEHELNSIKEKPHQQLREKLKLLLLPGSRNDEVRYLLPDFMATVKNLKQHLDVEVGVVRSSNVRQELWQHYKFDQVWHNENLAQALHWADLALATSGTVTLTCGLFQVPTVVAYKGSLLNQFIFETFVRYDAPVSLTNLVLNEMVFPEFLQERVSPFNLTRALLTWINDSSAYGQTKLKLKNVLPSLSGEVDAATVMAQVCNNGSNSQ